MPKQIPDFENEDEEREFWATHDSTDYLDWDQAQRAVFPKLKPSTKTISLRLSESMLNQDGGAKLWFGWGSGRYAWLIERWQQGRQGLVPISKIPRLP